MVSSNFTLEVTMSNPGYTPQTQYHRLENSYSTTVGHKYSITQRTRKCPLDQRVFSHTKEKREGKKEWYTIQTRGKQRRY